MSVRVIAGDCLEVMPTLAAGSVDAIVCDPPYGLAFMGKGWDSFGGRCNANADRDRAAEYDKIGKGAQPFGYSGSEVGNREQAGRFAEFSLQWAAAALRVVKPGGYMLAMGGTRTYHRLACAIEDAGWEIRDCLMWMYATGFPKGQGCLKPAYEPILLARRPGPRVLPLGIDACRIPTDGPTERPPLSTNKHEGYRRPWNSDEAARAACEARREEAHDKRDDMGRYPPNVAHDGSPEVLEAFAAFGSDRGSGPGKHTRGASTRIYGNGDGFTEATGEEIGYGDTGSAARFFFTAKSSSEERGKGNNHPTVKPLALMRWLVKLVCPVGGLVLDTFAGSGTTLLAASLEDRRAIGIEREPAYIDIINRRLANHEPLFRQPQPTQEELPT